MIVEVYFGTTFTPIWIALEWVTTGVKVVSLSPAVRCVGKDELPKKHQSLVINIPMQVEKVTIHTSIPQKHDIIYSHPARCGTFTLLHSLTAEPHLAITTT